MISASSLHYDDAFFADVPAKRLLAWLIDTGLITALVALSLPFTLFIGLLFLPFLFMVVGLVYRWVTIAQLSATPGMWMTGIEFRMLDGRKFDTATAFLHTLGYSISFSMVLPQVISIGLMLSTERKTGLGDLILGTVAVNRAILPR